MHPGSDPRVLSYWDHKAEQLKTDPAATMKDVVLRSMEIEAICRRLDPDDELLDVGAGNAYGSIIAAEHCARVVAMDYSSGMLRAATEAIAQSGRGNITAEEGNILELSGRFTRRFSAVSCVRVLINLRSEEEQVQAVREMADCIKPGGRLFLIEGIAERFAALNASRAAAGLDPIILNWHNTLPGEARLRQALEEEFEIREVVDFGEYYFLSRIVHPLMVAPEPPRFEAQVNKAARSIWQAGVARERFAELSTLALFVCERRP